MISVIIPHYNNQDVIERSINSVLKQTYQDFEIIIVDDLSKDIEKLEGIISNINDSRINLVKHKENRNGSSARNTGVENAKGEYVAFLDADDEWKNNHLQKNIEKVKSIDEPFILYSRSLVKTESTDGSPMPELAINNQSISEYLFCEKGFMPTPSFFLKRELALKVKWNESLKRHQDYDYLFQLEKHGVNFVMCDNIGVIIHWENNDKEKKGGTWEYSLNYAKSNKYFFSEKSYTCFLLKNVVFTLLEKRSVIKAISILFKEVNLLSIGFKNYIFIANYILFGNLKLVSKLLKLKK